ncbi:MAG TPA: 5'-nucleotidase C-terminal domain-containing protein [Ignavibacteria bacterium]|nr:5'-nucleotidase C-terminal domain-containing protein [Ignavibacteria bacterium]
MNKMITFLTFTFMMIFAAANMLNAQGTSVTILHTNDSHSHLDAVGPKNCNLEGTLGGIAKAATVIGMVKQSDQNVLTLHAGDFSVGDFFFNSYFGVPELQIMKMIGFDALTVGNHEFDLGPSTLNDVLTAGFEGGSFPVISANLDMTGYPSLTDFIHPYTIKNFGNVKVGIFGMTIPSPLSNSFPVVINENVAEIAYATVMELQGQGCNVIVFLSHLGSEIDKQIAANVPGINFIIGGHDHYVFNQPLVVMNPENKPVYICQAGSYYQNIGKLKFTYKNGKVIFNNYKLIQVNASVPPVPEIKAVIDELKSGISAQFGNVFKTIDGFALKDMNADNDPNSLTKDTPMGNLITDSYRDKTHTSIGITANGLIAEKIYRGAITSADVFRTVSYGYDVNTGLDFRLATFDIRGSELIKGLEVGLSMIGIDDDFFLQVSGMSFKFNPANAVGERVILSSVKINFAPLNPTKKYSVTVNEGLLGILTSLGGVEVENIVILPTAEYTGLKDYVRKLRILFYSPEGRIKEVANGDEIALENESDKLKFIFELKDNYPNPFNPSTTISYELASGGFTSLKIYDMLGKEVINLVNEKQDAGTYSVKWNASDYSSGVYFYKLETDGFIQTKRMILTK